MEDKGGTPSPITTTISTIAVESGGARIVIALLQSKEWLELRVIEMTPSLTLLGSTLLEATELLSTHEQVIAKICSKQSPVEELLRQADQLISSQHTRAEVCATMAETLSLAWQDVNTLLQRRKEILQLNVKYHSNASVCLERTRALELACSGAPLPFEVPELRELLSRLSEVKRAMLESLMAALQDGRTLLDVLRQISMEGSLDSRPGQIKASTDLSISQVERWLEDLHNRRRTLEMSWQSQKLQLEQCLAFALLTTDLRMLEEIYIDRMECILRNLDELGDSEASAQLLLEEHEKLLPEAKDLQEQGLKILRATEQLASTGHFAGDEAIAKAYQLLNTSTEYLDHLERREENLHNAKSFFNNAQKAIHTLEKMSEELYTSSSSINVTDLNTFKDSIVDNCTPVLKQGYDILENVSGAKGVKFVVEELEKCKLNLNLHITNLQEENAIAVKALNHYSEQYNKLYLWLTNTVEVFVEGQKDMGSVLAVARDFHQSQHKMLTELLNKEPEINSLMSTLPDLLPKCEVETKEEIEKKADSLRLKWTTLRQILEKRTELSMLYVKFHTIIVDLASNIDAFSEKLSNHKQEGDHKELAEQYNNISILSSQLGHVGDNFKKDSHQIPEPYLAVERARLCVDTLREHFSDRVANLQTLWQKWEEQLAATRQTAERWTRNMSDSTKTVDWVSSLEAQLYPVLSDSPSTAKSRVRDLEAKREKILTEIKRAQAEVLLRITTANEILAKDPSFAQDKNMLSQLSSLQDRLQQIATDYQVLLEMFISFFKNLTELEHTVQSLEGQYEKPINPSSLADVEKALREHDASRQAMQELLKFAQTESLQIITKIRQQEPNESSDKDVDCIRKILENQRTIWERAWAQHRVLLESQQQLAQFDSDLLHIHNNLDELMQQLSKVKGQFGEDLAAAKATSLAFHYFEKTIQLLEQRIDTFMCAGEAMLKSKHSSSPHIQQELVSLRNRWHQFHGQVGKTRQLIDLSLQYFGLVEEAENWFRDGSKLLMTIAKMSTSIKTPEEAIELLQKIELFLKPGESKQDERIKKISELAMEIYGDGHPEQLHQVRNESQDIIASFSQVSLELQQIVNFLNRPPEEQQMEIVGFQEALPIDEKPVKSSPSPPPKKAKVESETQPPNFTLPLHDAIIDEGSRFTFECRVSGIPTPEISWMKDNISIDNNLDYHTKVEGSLCSLTIEETFTEDSACFTCRATNPLGYAETTALLNVRENEREIPPVFVEHLSPTTSKEGLTCSLVCKVKGTPLPTVQWFKNNICVDSATNLCSTYNNGEAVLTINNIQLDDQGQYSCQATNRLGTEVTSAPLTVQPIIKGKAPVFVTQLSNIMARAGQKIKLECEISGVPEPDLKWTHNGKSLPDPRDLKFHYEKGKVVLIIPEAFPKDAGTYSLTAKNSSGYVTSSCEVTVKGRLPNDTSDSDLASDLEPCKPSMPTQLKDTAVFEGCKAQLDCVIVGQPEPEVIWYHENIPIKESKEVQLLFQGDRCSLIIAETLLEDDGEYKVVAINSAGQSSSTCRLTVQKSCLDNEPLIKTTVEPEGTKPQFISLLTDVLGTEGDSVTLECAVTGDPKPTVSWFLNNNPLPACDRFKMEHESGGLCFLQINPVVIDDKGVYTARATNCWGEAKCFAHLIVKSAANLSTVTTDIQLEEQKTIPYFTELFSDRTVANGNSTKFECIVTGKPTPKVKWLFNDKLVSGKDFLPSVSGSRQVLTIPAVCQTMSGGKVMCVAENDAGKASCCATITVNEAPPVNDLLSSIDHLNLAETSTFELKREVVMKTKSHTQFGRGEPIVELHGIATKAEQTSQKMGNKPNIQMETKQSSEYHSVGGLEHKLDTKSLSTTLAESETKVVHQRNQVPPRFVSPIMGKIVDQGADVSFECILEGFPIPTVIWEKNGETVVESKRLTTSWHLNKAQCMVKGVTIEDTGKYSCIATNPVGTASCTADLIVKKNVFPPVFGRRLLGDTVVAGKRTILEVEVTGTPDPEITWFKDGQQIASSSSMFRILDQGNSHRLIIENASHSHSGRYEVQAVNSGGEARSSADLLIIEAPDTYIIQHTDMDFSKLQDFAPQQKIVSCTETFKSDKKVSIHVERSEATLSTSNDTSSLTVNTQKMLPGQVKSINHEDEKNLPPSTVDKQLDTIIEDSSISKKSALNFFQEIINDNKSIKSTKPTKFTDKSLLLEPLPVIQPLLPVQQSFQLSESICTNEGTIIYPEPPPDIGFISKSQVTTSKEEMADKVKRLEEAHRLLPQEQIPPGGVRIFPSSKQTQSLESTKKYETETLTSNNYNFSEPPTGPVLPVTPLPSLNNQYSSSIYQVSSQETSFITNETKYEESEWKKNNSDFKFENQGLIIRPSANIQVRPESPRPSLEGISMEKLWTSKQKDEYIPFPHGSQAEEVLPPLQIFNSVNQKCSMDKSSSSFQEIKRTSSPLPSTAGSTSEKLRAPILNHQRTMSNLSTGEIPISPSVEGLAMDKLWAHKSSTTTKNWPPPQTYESNHLIPPWTNKSSQDYLSQNRDNHCEVSLNTKTLSEKTDTFESLKKVEKELSFTSNTTKNKPCQIESAFKEVSTIEKENSICSYIPPSSAGKITYIAEAHASHSTNIAQFPLSDTHIVTKDSLLVDRIEQINTSNTFEEKVLQTSEHVKLWPPPLPLSTSRSFLNDIPLEPGPPPEIAFAEPPLRRQSYVENIEQDLEKSIEKAPSKHLPGAVRIIPPPLKKDNKCATKMLHQERKPNVDKSIKEKVPFVPESIKNPLPNLEPFPFKPDPPKVKPMKCPPPPKPSKFVKGSFTESDYESDFDSVKIPVKWNPWQSDNEDCSYSKVKPPAVSPVKRPHSAMGQEIRLDKLEKQTTSTSLPQSCLTQKHDVPTISKYKLSQSEETSHKTVSNKEIKSVQNKTAFVTLGSPPEYNETPFPKHKPTTNNKPSSPKAKPKSVPSMGPESGYMADTDEPIQQPKMAKSEETVTTRTEQSMSYKQFRSEVKAISTHGSKTSTKKESFNTETQLLKQKKELPPVEIPTFKSETLKPSKHSNGPPPPSPSKFIKGEFRESDYESEYEGKIRPVWHPKESSDDMTFRPVRPVLTPVTGKTQNSARTPTPPTEFDEPPNFSGPPRPKFEPIDKPKTGGKVRHVAVEKTNLIRPKPVQAHSSSHIETIYATPAIKPTPEFVLKPGSPPKMDYAPPPGYVEKSNVVNFTESTSNSKRVVSVQQTTRVMQFGNTNFNQVQTKENLPPRNSASAFTKDYNYDSVIDGTSIKHMRTPYLEAENKRLKRVEEMKMKFLETESLLQPGEPPEFVYCPEPTKAAYSAATTEMNKMTETFKGKTQKFVSDILTDMKTSQKTCNDKALLNTNVDEPQTYRDENRLKEYGSKQIDPDTGLIYFKYDFGYEFGIVLPGEKKPGPHPKLESSPQKKEEGTIDIPVIHETQKKKLSKVKSVKWEPTSESEMSEIESEKTKQETLKSHVNFFTPSPNSPTPSIKSLSPYPNLGHDKTVSPGNLTQLAESTNIVRAISPRDQPKKAPIFIAPLRDIACISRQPARFECIVLAEPAPTVSWFKDGVPLQHSTKYQMEYRNGVCRLVLPEAGQVDVGQYSCSASNSLGTCVTSASLQVPGERRPLL